LPAQDPLRAGIDVPEPKLIKKVEIPYPNSAMISDKTGAVILNLLIDEQGAIAKITERHQDDIAFLAPVLSAVKQWRFSKTYLNGKAVPVIATAVAIFSQISTPNAIDLGSPANEFRTVVRPCLFPLIMDRNGNVEETNSHTYCLGGEKINTLIPKPDVSFSTITERMKNRAPLPFYDIQTPRYRYPRFISEHPDLTQLYYSTLLVSNKSQLIQLAGIDPDVQPPKFDIDISRLAKSLIDSRHKNEIVNFFTIFVNERGRILGVESSDSKNKAVETALSNAAVLAPGTRNGKPVPTAVILAIPVE
jgi:hypothetical protein